jgi:2-polyprenyl-3-methyl-5-hydroxy-6-metoxy-1,4-benzoquinol methylase
MICPICESSDFVTLYSLSNGEVVRCRGCTTVCRKRLVSGESAVQLYNDSSYFDSPFFDVLRVGARTDVQPYPVYRHALRKFEGIVEGRRLLDVGCAYGAFLEMARGRGWEVSGVDLSEVACAYARQERDLHVFHGSLEQANYPGNHFSVVTLWDLIEHLDRPLDTLFEVRRILAPGGLLFVFTINQGSLVNRVGHLLHRATFGRYSQPLVLLYDIHHNFFFTRKTLRGLLQRAGLGRIVAFDEMDAKISRWKTVPISPLMTVGCNCLDLASRAFGGRYRMLIFAAKDAGSDGYRATTPGSG